MFGHLFSRHDRLEGSIAAAVKFCCHYAVLVLAAAIIIAVASLFYMRATIIINTDTETLLNPDLPFLQDERNFDALFPDNSETIVIVIDGPDQIAAEIAAENLLEHLQTRQDLFPTLLRPTGGKFFRDNGLLFLSYADLVDRVNDLSGAQGFIASLNQDRTLNGLLSVFQTALDHPDQLNQAGRQRLDQAFIATADVIQSALENNAPIETLNWGLLFSDKTLQKHNRRFIIAKPKLDSTQLAQASAATAFLRTAITDLGLDRHGYQVHLTGEVLLADEELAVITAGASVATPISLILVIGLLYAAFRSFRLVLAIAVTLVLALAASLGFATLTVGRFNPISMAFSVMFIGIAVDFGIQFATRFGAEARAGLDRAAALQQTAIQLGPSLIIAAITVSVGFLSFLPTDYHAVRELGIIAAGGIIIALIYNLTVLPATITLLNPDPGQYPPPPRWSGMITATIRRWRRSVLLVVLIGFIGGLALLPGLRFDFDPIKLKNPDSESVRTLNLLRDDIWATPDTISILAADQNSAAARASILEQSDKIRRALTLDAFVPADQEKKLRLIDDLRFTLEPALFPPPPSPNPPDSTAIRAAISDFLAANNALPLSLIVALQNLAGQLAELPKTTADDLSARLNHALFTRFDDWIGFIADALNATSFTRDDLPEPLRRLWIATDGRARIQLYPQGDPRNAATLEAFVKEIRDSDPSAVGTPVTLYEAGRQVVKSFLQAAFFALLLITLLLILLFRKFRDVIEILFPLLLSIVFVLGFCVLAGIMLNFANIIALPLLMGIGITFPIYFVVARYRSISPTADYHAIEAGLARAILYSVLTTMAAFASLNLYNHQGTKDIGFLLCFSLAVILLTTFIVIPAAARAPKPLQPIGVNPPNG